MVTVAVRPDLAIDSHDAGHRATIKEVAGEVGPKARVAEGEQGGRDKEGKTK